MSVVGPAGGIWNKLWLQRLLLFAGLLVPAAVLYLVAAWTRSVPEYVAWIPIALLFSPGAVWLATEFFDGPPETVRWYNGLLLKICAILHGIVGLVWSVAALGSMIEFPLLSLPGIVWMWGLAPPLFLAGDARMRATAATWKLENCVWAPLPVDSAPPPPRSVWRKGWLQYLVFFVGLLLPLALCGLISKGTGISVAGLALASGFIVALQLEIFERGRPGFGSAYLWLTGLLMKFDAILHSLTGMFVMYLLVESDNVLAHRVTLPLSLGVPLIFFLWALAAMLYLAGDYRMHSKLKEH